MKAPSTQKLSKNFSPAKRTGRLPESVPKARIRSTMSTGSIVHQSKPSCACGGGCPRCQAELDSQPKQKCNALGDESDVSLIHKNAAEDPEEIEPMAEPSSAELGQEKLLPEPFEAIPPARKGEFPSGVDLLEAKEEAKTPCPSKTVVEKTIDMTPDGIKKGYRTGYGAAAVMRVESTKKDWDGTQIVESLKQTKNTCPEDFKISPCSGDSTFTVGSESKSSVLGTLEAKQNRFYDFHISRWNKGSLLHDRNPDNVDSCQIECEQAYSCGKTMIGKHTVTRIFTKGKSGSRDVTLVTVSKK